MVLNCPQCTARLQLEDHKLPARPFTVRCPKCQHIINAQPPVAPADNCVLALDDAASQPPARLERPVTAPRFRLDSTTPDAVQAEETASVSSTPVAPDQDEMARLLSVLLQRTLLTTTGEVSKGPLRRPVEQRHALVCVEAAELRFEIARTLAEHGYQVFVAEDSVQAIGRMREDWMDIVILDPNFDLSEQGAVFIKREIGALRPVDRRRVFFVLLMPDARTGDAHAAFIRHANFVVSPADIELLPLALERSVREFAELYRDFNKSTGLAII